MSHAWLMYSRDPRHDTFSTPSEDPRVADGELLWPALSPAAVSVGYLNRTASNLRREGSSEVEQGLK